jgi:putative ABC transport system permease protein
MSLGASRRTIVAQLLLETLVIAVLALIVASALSYCLAGSVGNIAEAAASPKNAEETFDYHYQLELDIRPCIDKTSADPIDLTYGLTVSNILIVSLAVLAVTAGSVLITSWNVLKLKPNHLLTRR